MLINKKILIFTATYNEKDNIGKLIKLVKKYCPFADMLIVDDNSPDNTSDEILFLKQKFKNILLIQRRSKLGLDTAHKLAYNYGLKNNLNFHLIFSFFQRNLFTMRLNMPLPPFN